MREIVHIQAGQCGNQIGAKVCTYLNIKGFFFLKVESCIDYIRKYFICFTKSRKEKVKGSLNFNGFIFKSTSLLFKHLRHFVVCNLLVYMFFTYTY